MQVCRVCSSIHKEIIEKMKFVENRKITDIHKYISDNYPEEDLSYHSIQRHLLHARNQMEHLRNTSELRNRIVEDSIKKDIEIAKRIERNLIICDQLLNTYIENGQLRELTTEELRELFLTMAEARRVIDQMLKWRKDINIESSNTDMYEKILYCMKDFPLDLIKKFRDRWDTYDSK